jgi:hypothetical protein
MQRYTKLTTQASRLLRAGIERGLTFGQITSDPQSIAATTGLEVTGESETQLRALATSELRDRVAGLSDDALQILHRIVLDGKHLKDWRNDIPRTCADLGMQCTPQVEAELAVFRLDDLIQYEPQYLAYIGTISIAVAVVVGAAVANDRFGPQKVIDLSGIPKF